MKNKWDSGLETITEEPLMAGMQRTKKCPAALLRWKWHAEGTFSQE